MPKEHVDHCKSTTDKSTAALHIFKENHRQYQVDSVKLLKNVNNHAQLNYHGKYGKHKHSLMASNLGLSDFSLYSLH